MASSSASKWFRHPVSAPSLTSNPVVERDAAAAKVLVIQRASSCRVHEKPLEPQDIKAGFLPVWGILGIVTIDSHFFLVLCTEKSLAGQLQGKNMWQVREVRLVCFSGNDTQLEPHQQEFKEGIEKLLM